MWNPRDVARGPIFASKNYRNFGPKHGWVTGAPLAPLRTALTLAGARRVDATEFRSLNGDFELERPLVNRDCTAWELPERKACVGKEYHEWPLGVRLGAPAPNEWPRRIYELPPNSPGIRKAAFREARMSSVVGA